MEWAGKGEHHQPQSPFLQLTRDLHTLKSGPPPHPKSDPLPDYEPHWGSLAKTEPGELGFLL